jgi:1-acyl-sn-glycerol-3-phosphate acyltransferase
LEDFQPLGPLRTAAACSAFALLGSAYVPALLQARICHRSDPLHRQAGRQLRRFGRHVCRYNSGWRFSIEGSPPSDIQERSYVVVSNHRSAADPFLLAHLPWDMRWVVKRELLDVPLVGTLIRLGGDIPVDRASRAGAVALLAECERTLRSGLSVMIFPEGTRHPQQLGPFKNGAFRLAVQLGVPILPVALTGTHQCLTTGPWRLGTAVARARILEPVATQGLSLRDASSLCHQVRESILLALRDMETASALPSQPTPGSC